MTLGELVLDKLQGYGLKHERGGQYRLNSPLRPGSNSMAFCLLIHDDGDDGAYYDNVTHEYGSLYSLAEKLGIVVKRGPAADTKRAYTGLADYAKAHGVEAAVFEAAKWKEQPYFDYEAGKERPALAIETANGLRYRFLDGGKPPYRSPAGYKNCWYGLKRALVLAQGGQALVLCNGAPSVVVAQHYGVAAAALAQGGTRIPDGLLTELKTVWGGDILIAMDCDAEGAIATREYLEQLPQALVVDLKLTDKGDLADFCALYREGSAAELARRGLRFEQAEAEQEVGALHNLLKDVAKAQRAGALIPIPADVLEKAQQELDDLRQKVVPAKIHSFAELVGANHRALAQRRKTPNSIQGLHSHLPTLDKMVGGWVGGRVYMLYGDTGMGKSTLAISIISQWIRQGPGLIVPTECPPGAYLDKLVAHYCKLPYDLLDTGRLTDAQYSEIEKGYVWLEQQGCEVMGVGSPTPGMLGTALREGMKRRGFKWVLIDSLSKFEVPFATDIYTITRTAANAVQSFASEYKIPFLVTTQVGRNLKDRANKMPMPNDALGAGTVEQNADVILSLYNHDYYVKLGQCDADPRYPPETALVRLLKHRWREVQGAGEAVVLKFIGGAGFYERAYENGK